MAKTQFPDAIRSRPVYGELAPQPGTAHLVIVDDEGGEAVFDMLARAGDDAAAMLEAMHLIYISAPRDDDRAARLSALRPRSFYHGPTWGAAAERIGKAFADAHMGTRVYLAGSESLIGLATRAAMEAGYPHAAIQTEHRGSKARRVQCVHCKGITDGVTTEPVRCSHCGLMLHVRDHYSRRIAAFQGVNIDAEDPGTAPEPVETYR